ncbi:MAG TPA: glutaredoxin family protein [Planococcus sp. (in: firmicutes)]|nr:glutaredoxin family protein [Planococcus sp. (in: firmicutes)]
MITLFTRANCPLCDEAKLMLKLVQEDFDIEWVEVDIESDDALHEKYMLIIPVIEHNGKTVIYGNVGYIELLEALEL